MTNDENTVVEHSLSKFPISGKVAAIFIVSVVLFNIVLSFSILAHLKFDLDVMTVVVEFVVFPIASLLAALPFALIRYRDLGYWEKHKAISFFIYFLLSCCFAGFNIMILWNLIRMGGIPH